MAKKKMDIEEPSKKFNDTFRSICGRHTGYDVWRDYVVTFACLISMSVTPEHFDVRKERYEKIRQKYNEREQKLIKFVSEGKVLNMMSVLCKIKHRKCCRVYETCIICGKLTDVPKSRPVSEREGYIRGCGQTCPKCYSEIEKSIR